MMGVAGILGGALLCAIHGATVEKLVQNARRIFFTRQLKNI
jgi:hypothetical protein